jgi:hypothetical protein
MQIAIYKINRIRILPAMNRQRFQAVLPAILSLIVMGAFASATQAQHQTPTTTPLSPAGVLPYRVTLQEADYSGIDLPTLHSYAVGTFDNKWLFISGRTNGLHGFDALFEPEENFPVRHQNRDVWVVDLEAKQSWSKPLDHLTSGLTESQILSLATTNNQFYQRNGTLFVTGGYGVLENGEDFTTFDTLSAIDLQGLGEWVMNGTGSASNNIRQIHDPIFRVTGGAMHQIGDRTHLVFGQDFDGIYTPFGDGTYTQQVRSFEIIDDGINLSVQNVTSTPSVPAYRRRDLNVVPILRPDGSGGIEEKLLALSGVFTLETGAWTVPVEIDADGQPFMADPDLANTFKQGFNGYHSAKLGMFSQARGEMNEILFGGISLQYLDQTTSNVLTDTALPFVNDITSVRIDAAGNYSQHHLGFFPELFDTGGIPLRFGANAEFLLAEGVPVFENGVIDFDSLPPGETLLGYIFGGIVTNGPHTRLGALSSGSNHVFEVRVMIVPEPQAIILGIVAAGPILLARRWCIC